MTLITFAHSLCLPTGDTFLVTPVHYQVLQAGPKKAAAVSPFSFALYNQWFNHYIFRPFSLAYYLYIFLLQRWLTAIKQIQKFWYNLKKGRNNKPDFHTASHLGSGPVHDARTHFSAKVNLKH